MTKKRWALLLMAAGAFAGGAVATGFATHRVALDGVAIALQVFVGGVLMFLWLHGDERDVRYRRSRAMSMFIAGFAVIALPVYLVRARPRGKRIRAVILFFLWLVALFALGIAGGVVGLLLFGMPLVG